MRDDDEQTDEEVERWVDQQVKASRLRKALNDPEKALEQAYRFGFRHAKDFNGPRFKVVNMFQELGRENPGTACEELEDMYWRGYAAGERDR